MIESSKALLKDYWAALLWAAFILVICGVPGTELPDIDFWALNIEDKIAHIGIFFVLAVLLVWGFVRKSGGSIPTYKTLFLFCFFGILYGALTEALQHFVFVGRFASFADFLADSIGSVFGTVFAFFWFKTRKSVH